MHITWFGHSAFRLDFPGARVMIDPFLTGNPAFEGAPEAAWEGTTHVLVTHGHSDHLGDALAIAAATGAPVVANYELCERLTAQGLTDAVPLSTGGGVDLGAFRATLVWAAHGSAEMIDGALQSLGPPGGLVVKPTDTAEPTVYHMGDTDVFGDMALIAELHQPRVGLVPVGDRFTMGPEVAALACRRFFAFEAVVPCHYATFPPLLPSAERFVEAMRGSDTRVVVPMKGEPFAL